MIEDTASFGTLVRTHRVAAMLSQEELAELSGLSVHAISDIERGLTIAPHRRSVARLADALGIHDREREDFAAAPARRLARAQAPVQHTWPRTAGMIPRQLPPGVPGFAGRREQLDTLSRLLAPGSNGTRAAVIWGMGGVGKTALALHWAHQVSAEFPDGQLFAGLNGFGPSGRPARPVDVVRTLLEGLNVPPDRFPQSLDGQIALYRSLLAGRRVLVVLDNACSAAQVRPLLPGSTTCFLLATSRTEMPELVALDGAASLALPVLDASAARGLLEHKAGAERIETDEGAVADIIERCGRLPLALSITGARLAIRPGLALSAVATELGRERERLDALDLGSGQDADVRSVFGWSYRSLSGAAQRMFRMLGVHPGPDFSLTAAASAAGVSRPEAHTLLGELTRAHLLACRADGWYAFHDLVGLFAAELVEAGQGQQVLRRILDHYLAAAYSAKVGHHRRPCIIEPPPRADGVLVEDLDDRPAAVGWFGRQYRVLIRLVPLAAGHGFDDHSRQLAHALAPFVGWRARLNDWEPGDLLAEGQPFSTSSA